MRGWGGGGETDRQRSLQGGGGGERFKLYMDHLKKKISKNKTVVTVYKTVSLWSVQI